MKKWNECEEAGWRRRSDLYYVGQSDVGVSFLSFSPRTKQPAEDPRTAGVCVWGEEAEKVRKTFPFSCSRRSTLKKTGREGLCLVGVGGGMPLSLSPFPSFWVSQDCFVRGELEWRLKIVRGSGRVKKRVLRTGKGVEKLEPGLVNVITKFQSDHVVG